MPSYFLEADFVLDSYQGSYLKKKFLIKEGSRSQRFPCIFRTPKNLPKHNKIQHENGRLLLVLSKVFLLHFSPKETTTAQFLPVKLLNPTIVIDMLRPPAQKRKNYNYW